MTVDSFDVVFYTAVFLLPGFIICSIVDQVNPPQRYNEAKYFLKYLLYSIINCAVWCWVYRIIIDCDCLSTLWHWILLVLVSLVGSSIIGFVIAIIKQKQFIDRLLFKLKIKTIHSTPTAWDYFFSKQESSYVIVTLVDGTKLYGYYSLNSFTSSDPDERDMYIEKLYDEEWNTDNEDAGAYIAKEQIKYIEFRKGENKNV